MRLSYIVLDPRLISQSSLLAHPPHVRWAWLALITEATVNDGILEGLTAFQLSRLAAISLDEAATALSIFTAPDPYSACVDEEGRKLVPITDRPNTYRVVSFPRHQNLIERASAAARQRRSRQAAHSSMDVTPRHSASQQNVTGHTTTTTTTTDTELKESKSRVASAIAAAALPRPIAEKKALAPRKKQETAHRLPDPFVLSAADREYAEKQFSGLGISIDATLEAFTDHWRAESGAKARKLDWSAAWRTWVRRAVEYSSSQRSSPRRRANALSDADAASLSIGSHSRTTTDAEHASAAEIADALRERFKSRLVEVKAWLAEHPAGNAKLSVTQAKMWASHFREVAGMSWDEWTTMRDRYIAEGGN